MPKMKKLLLDTDAAQSKSNSDGDSRQSWGFLCGAMALQSDAYELEENVILVSPTPSPEEEAERSLRIGGLTADARLIMELVVNTPAEAIQHLYAPLRSQTSRARLFGYLHKVMGWDRPKIRNTFSELTEYVAEL